MKNKLLKMVSLILAICFVFGVSAAAQDTFEATPTANSDEQITETPTKP